MYMATGPHWTSWLRICYCETSASQVIVVQSSLLTGYTVKNQATRNGRHIRKPQKSWSNNIKEGVDKPVTTVVVVHCRRQKSIDSHHSRGACLSAYPKTVEYQGNWASYNNMNCLNQASDLFSSEFLAESLTFGLFFIELTLDFGKWRRLVVMTGRQYPQLIDNQQI